MKFNWNIGFEWVVTGAAVIGVIALMIAGEKTGEAETARLGSQVVGSNH